MDSPNSGLFINAVLFFLGRLSRKEQKSKSCLLWHLESTCLLSPVDSTISDQDVLQQYSASSQKRPRSDQQLDKPVLTRQSWPRNRFATLLQRRTQEDEENGQATFSRWHHRDSSSANHHLLLRLILWVPFGPRVCGSFGLTLCDCMYSEHQL